MNAEAGKLYLTWTTDGKLRSFNAAGGDSRPVEFDLLAYTGGPLKFAEFDAVAVIDIATLQLPENTTQVPLLLDHDFRQPVGHAPYDQLTVDPSEGITAKGFASVDSPYRDRVVNSTADGFEWQLSIGGTAPEDEIEFYGEGQTVRVNNRTFAGPVVVIRNYLLKETSFLSMGADQTGAVARVALVAALRLKTEGSKMTFEAWLESKGIDIEGLTAKALQFLRDTFNEEQSAETDAEESAEDDSAEDADESAGTDVEDSAEDATDDPLDEYERRMADVTADATERNEELVALNARFSPGQIEVGGRQIPLLAHAQRNRWTSERFELECRRRERPAPRNTRRKETSGQGRAVILASMVYSVMERASCRIDREFKSLSSRMYLNANFRLSPNDEARQRAMNAAYDYRHHGLIDLVADAMALDGVECSSPKKSDQWFRAAFSSNTVQELFTQSAQAILLDTYEQTGNKLAPIVRERDVPNFKTNERKSVSPDTGELEKLNPTGTAGDATLSASGEEYKIARFSKRWGIDDQDMINEDFGVFEDMPQFLGRSSARLFDQVIVKLLLSNPNLKDGAAWLSAAAGNLRTGSALSAANLKLALTDFSTLTDGSVNLELNPNVALVPSALRFLLAEILSAAARVTGENATTTSQNVLSNEIDRQIWSAMLDNGITDPDDRDTSIAGSATDWWLFDTQYPAIEVGHLMGTGRGPQIRSGVYSDGRYGVWFDVKRDIGAAPLRRESVQKNEA